MMISKRIRTMDDWIDLFKLWQEDIGLAAEAVIKEDEGPAVLFEDVPGCAPGHRVLMNVFAGTSSHTTSPRPFIFVRTTFVFT